jgi:hypothetical protein
MPLVSKQLSGLGMPNVMFKYDLFLSNFSTATVEQFAVEVWNGSAWVLVANYTNAGGSIPWTTYTHNITSHAQGQQFKVRFRANGANSFNINNWNVDNIMVYGEVADGGDRGVIGYYVYLDDLVAGFATETNFTFSPQNVAYGETYTAGVRAVYESGFSPMITYNFTSLWLAKPRNLEGEDINHGVTLTWDAPIIPESYEFIPSADPIVVTDANADISPVTYQISGEPTRALFDLLASFPVGDVGGTYSVATDGQFVYSARWNALLFHKYTMSGTLIESFTIAGAGNIRDLTYDGEFFYGAPNSTTIYKMNFATQTLVSTITAPALVRGIAYDAVNDGFWITNGWDGPLRLISRTGTTLQTLTTAAASMAGLAWDNISEGGPYLWAYTQTGSLHVLAKINLTTGAIIQTFDVATLGITGAGSSAGGLTITNLMIPGKWTFVGCSQNDIFWVLELADDQGGGGGGTIVEPFAYNVYKDGALLATVDGDVLTYTDQPLVAGTYSYTVSALYEYGANLVESPLEGPIDVVVAPGFGFVQGIVFDCATFQPIGGVTVTAGNFSTTTQANGTYSLVAHEGVYDIHFDKIGYALHVEENFEIVWQQTKTLNVCLTEKEPNFPFEENWSSGSFGTQGWTFVPAQGNWRISTTVGNPAPSAEFYWSPSVTNYSNSLTSVEIDARAALQNVTLEYSIFLSNYSATSAEKMTVEIWNGEAWVFVAEYKNDNSIPWTNYQHDVTAHAAGKMTRIRFGQMVPTALTLITGILITSGCARSCLLKLLLIQLH